MNKKTTASIGQGDGDWSLPKTDWFILILVPVCFLAGLIFDHHPWIVVSSALLIPVLFVWLILAYTKKDVGSVNLSLVWGILGIAMLVFGIYSDPKVVNSHIVSVIVNLSSTLISLAAIGVILQLKDAKEYFASTLSDLIMRESYVEKLNRSQLEKLQKTVLERYFENSSDLNRENSFYRFFSKNLQKYIGSPYRENYRNTLSISMDEVEGGLMSSVVMSLTILHTNFAQWDQICRARFYGEQLKTRSRL